MSRPVTNLYTHYDALDAIRMAVYHSDGPGYWVARAAVSDSFIAHMRAIWGGEATQKHWAPLTKNAEVRYGSPNMARVEQNRNGGFRTYHNWFWNTPFDELTQSVAFESQLMRNYLEGREPFHAYVPAGDSHQAVQYFIRQDLAGDMLVPFHADIIDTPPPANAAAIHSHDPSRLQITLLLSKRGVDYQGDGLVYTRNDGSEIVLDDEVGLNAGDIVFWRHANRHSIRNIRAINGGLGYLRMIMPVHDLRG